MFKVLPLTLTPLASLPDVSLRALTFKLSLVSTSLAFCSRLILKLASSSVRVSDMTAETVGISFAPMMVTVAVVGVIPPLLSMTL